MGIGFKGQQVEGKAPTPLEQERELNRLIRKGREVESAAPRDFAPRRGSSWAEVQIRPTPPGVGRDTRWEDD
jgi:hypothetical protein